MRSSSGAPIRENVALTGNGRGGINFCAGSFQDHDSGFAGQRIDAAAFNGREFDAPGHDIGAQARLLHQI
jgi:hypothetical protein